MDWFNLLLVYGVHILFEILRNCILVVTFSNILLQFYKFSSCCKIMNSESPVLRSCWNKFIKLNMTWAGNWRQPYTIDFKTTYHIHVYRILHPYFIPTYMSVRDRRLELLKLAGKKDTYTKPALVIFTLTIWQAVVFSNNVPHIVNAQIYKRAVPFISNSNIDITTFHNNELKRNV